MNENISLIQKVADLENVLNQSETAKANMAQKQKEDAVELATLRKACQMQKTDISELESTVAGLKSEVDGERMSADDRLKAKVKECEADMKSMAEDYEGKLKNMEEIFMDERTKIKAELHEVNCTSIVFCVCMTSFSFTRRLQAMKSTFSIESSAWRQMRVTLVLNWTDSYRRRGPWKKPKESSRSELRDLKQNCCVLMPQSTNRSPR